jgi:predicted DNA-binding transcriptional regulator AlpA
MRRDVGLERRHPGYLSCAYSRLMGKQRIHLVGTQEIRVRLGGISRQRVYQITRRHDFPPPIAELGQGNVWLAEDVDAWVWQRRPQLTADPWMPDD